MEISNVRIKSFLYPLGNFAVENLNFANLDPHTHLKNYLYYIYIRLSTRRCIHLGVTGRCISVGVDKLIANSKKLNVVCVCL